MKAAEPKTSAASQPAKKNSPFFNKEGGEDFFHTTVTEQPFFASHETSTTTIQPKLRVGRPNDPFEQEADAMADKVINIQAKCAACEAAEKKQEKEEKKNKGPEEELQRKPIFESNEDKAIQNKPILPVQRKLTVGAPDDKYEKEADAVADKVVQSKEEPAPMLQKKAEPVINPITPNLQAKCNACDATAITPSADQTEDKLQEKEEDKENELPSKIHRKPVFENIAPPNGYLQRRCRECEEGSEVFLKAIDTVQRDTLADNAPTADGSRESIVAMARTMIGKIEAKHDDGSGKRVGADKLLEIFHLAAPGVWDDATIENINGQLPTWCGIFTVWAHKKAGKDIGNWQMGKGVSAFGTLTQTDNPQPGDIGYMNPKLQHHCIVVKIEEDTVHSIDGNSGLFSEVKENQRQRNEYLGFFTAFAGSGSGVQRKEEDTGSSLNAGSHIEKQLNASKGSGQPIPEETRTGIEQTMGADFSKVRVHTDTTAVQMSKDLHAQAFTHGSDIYFNSGKYDPGSAGGQHLLAHELTHTIQQNGVTRLKPEQVTNGQQIVQKKDEEPKPIKVDPSNIPTIEKAAKDLYVWLSTPSTSSNREAIFRTILLQKGAGQALRDEYKKQNKVDLDEVLVSSLNKKDAIRAKRYLDYGELRIADKIYIASEGAGTDEDTLFRLMPMAFKSKAKVEDDFAKQDEYTKDYPGTKSLPNKESSRIAALLEDELSGTDLDKAKALFAFGELRPVDEIRIAIEDTRVNDLYNGLKNGMGSDSDKNKAFFNLENEYLRSYDSELFSKLVMMYQHGDLSEKEKLKVWQIIGKGSALERIKYAVAGIGTDEEEIYDAIRTASPEELKTLRVQFNDKNSELYKLLDDDLNEEEMKRVAALLTEDPTAQQQLEQAGAFSGSDILQEIKMSSGDRFYKYKEAFNNTDGVFEGYISKKMDAAEKGYTISVINGTPEEKINMAIGKFTDDEDYIYHVLKYFVANDPAKEAILNNKDLMAKLESNLSTSEYNKCLDLLALENDSIENRVKRTGEKIKRERSFIADLTNAGDAMDDEYRELTAALERAKADGELSPEEQKQLSKMQQQTDQSIEVYTKVRDELEEHAATVLTTVTAVLIAIGTGGLGSGLSAAMIAQQLAQAALVSACARVAAMKVAKGDRFEVFGADGASSFAAGAVDGVFNVFGGAAASKVVDKVFQEAVEGAAKQAGGKAFQSVGRKILTDAVEGGMSAGVGAAVESSSKEETWKGGFVTGIETVVEKTATSAAVGAGVGAGISAAGMIIGKIRSKKPGEVADDVNAPGNKTDLGDEAEVLKIKEQVEKQQLDNVLKNTAKKQGSELTQLELNAEIHWAMKNGKANPSSIEGYTHEIELGNGHFLRKGKDGRWCRFSPPPPKLCMTSPDLDHLLETNPTTSVKDEASARLTKRNLTEAQIADYKKKLYLRDEMINGQMRPVYRPTGTPGINKALVEEGFIFDLTTYRSRVIPSNVDPDFVPPMIYQNGRLAPNTSKLRNRDLAASGRTPFFGDNVQVELHHNDQNFFETLMETHAGNHGHANTDLDVHPYADDPAYISWRHEYGFHNGTLKTLGDIYNAFRVEYWKNRW